MFVAKSMCKIQIHVDVECFKEHAIAAANFHQYVTLFDALNFVMYFCKKLVCLLARAFTTSLPEV
jgi:hypothetical protein